MPFPGLPALALLAALVTPPPQAPPVYRPPPVPAADHEGVTWGYKELLAHLNARGLGLTLERWHGEPPSPCWASAKGQPLCPRLCDDPNAALRFAAASRKVLADVPGGDRTAVFTWGRFLFVGDSALVARAAEALGASLTPPAP
jgi:hypothetical protein